MPREREIGLKCYLNEIKSCVRVSREKVRLFRLSGVDPVPNGKKVFQNG